MGLSLPDLTREQKRDDQATEVSVLSFEKAHDGVQPCRGCDVVAARGALRETRTAARQDLSVGRFGIALRQADLSNPYLNLGRFGGLAEATQIGRGEGHAP
jgi:hypothetical protein